MSVVTTNWYVSTNGSTWVTCASLGIERPILTLRANGLDELTFRVTTDFIGTAAFAYDATLHLAYGVVTDGTRFVGGLDGQGNAYSWEALGSGKAIPFGKVAFDVGAPNQPHAIAMASQTIAVPQGNYRTINLAATAVNGPRQDRLFKLLFTDGSTDSWVQSISDWASPQNYAGETLIATMDYRNKGDGTKDGRPVNLYGYSRAIPQGKTLKSITLMQTDAKVKILDIKMGS